VSSTTVNIREAKTHLSRLVERAREGETTTIAKAGKPKVMLTPVPSPGQVFGRNCHGGRF
jgi:prevent-host-death family protein